MFTETGARLRTSGSGGNPGGVLCPGSPGLQVSFLRDNGTVVSTVMSLSLNPQTSPEVYYYSGESLRHHLSTRHVWVFGMSVFGPLSPFCSCRSFPCATDPFPRGRRTPQVCLRDSTRRRNPPSSRPTYGVSHRKITCMSRFGSELNLHLQTRRGSSRDRNS